jgi:ADP-ribosyl-[dinitrogen reductase] hydrolase
MMVDVAPIDRYLGCLRGLACGDAVGATVEFTRCGTFASVTDLEGGGPFGLVAGEWTDDTSMALCLVSRLVHCHGTRLDDQVSRYVNWWQWGYPSSNGNCFDIGMTVRAALNRYPTTKNPVAGSTDARSASNGSLMHRAPVATWLAPDLAAVRLNARPSSATTHGAPEAIGCCELCAELLSRALAGALRDALLRAPASATFEEAVLAAANLGDDADTTAAIVGQIAGAHDGVDGIPTHWRDKIVMRDELDELARALSRR